MSWKIGLWIFMNEVTLYKLLLPHRNNGKTEKWSYCPYPISLPLRLDIGVKGYEVLLFLGHKGAQLQNRKEPSELWASLFSSYPSLF